MRSRAWERLKFDRPLGLSELLGAAVEVERELRLAQVIEADGEVVGVVGVVGLEVMRLEIGLLRLRPLRLVGVEVAEHEMQERRWLARDQLLQAALGGCRDPRGP